MNYFQQQLDADQSANELRKLINGIYAWMEDNHYLSPHIVERFDQIHSIFEDPHRNILFLAEFSRGKSELGQYHHLRAFGRGCSLSPVLTRAYNPLHHGVTVRRVPIALYPITPHSGRRQCAEPNAIYAGRTPGVAAVHFFRG